MPHEPDNWIDPDRIDDELRRVPLPAGLLARLRAAGRLTDDDVDEALCEVAIPSGLLDRLTRIVDDEKVDQQLADVPLPAGLLENLAFIPHEEQLLDVPLPADFLVRLRRIPPRRKRRIPTMHLAMAASLMLMITAGYVLSIAGLMMNAYDQLPETYAVFTLDLPRVELTSSVSAADALAIEMPAAVVATTSAEAQPARFDVTTDDVDTRSISQSLAAFAGDGYSLADSIVPLQYGILGHAFTAEDRTPDLELLGGLQPHGQQPPLAVGFDRKFLITERTNPMVSLAAIQRMADDSERRAILETLGRSELPLWTTTGSFDQLRGVTDKQRLPSAREIHVEDFLAAVDFQYAAAKPGELAIRATAGPSVFGEDFAQLMQVGVQAGTVKHNDHASTHITLAIDISESMRWENRLNIVRAAVRDFARLLRPADRISLVVFNGRAYALLEDIAGDDLQSLTLTLDQLSPHGGTNIVAGLEVAADLATSPSAMRCEHRRLVVISDGMPALGKVTADGVAELVADLLEQEIAVDVVAIESGGGLDGLGSPSYDGGLRQLVAMAGSQMIECDNARQLHEQLCDRLISTSPLVARDATVTITFNPKSVRAYRLLGHEVTGAGGILSAETKSTMLAGQAATALHEVWLEDNGPSLVATVHVQWGDADGRAHSASQEIHRNQFKPSWREAALPLQAAAIAAEAAEVLRESPFSSAKGGDLREVLAQADEVNPNLGRRESFQQFLRVLKQAEAVRRGVSFEE